MNTNQSGQQNKEVEVNETEQQIGTESTPKKVNRKQLKAERKKNKKPRRRIFPIWLRIIVVLILCGVALMLGLVIGYGVIGDGVPSDALKKETWQHIVDIVNKKE